MLQNSSIRGALLSLLSLVVCPNSDGHAQQVRQRDKDQAAFSYHYGGKLVSLSPSKELVAISEQGDAFDAVALGQKLQRDPLSDREPVKAQKYGLYRLSDSPRPDVELWNETKADAGREVQPVFEQGQALLIPSDEVIVRFREDGDLAEANQRLAPLKEELKISEVREHRKNTFIATILEPARGRVFPVAQKLSELPNVRFAEPNFIILMFDEPAQPKAADEAGEEESPKVDRAEPERSPPKNGTSDVRSSEVERRQPVCWTTLIEEDFEAAALPSGWNTGNATGTTDALWTVTCQRSHAGQQCAYATGGGGAGVPAPGPYPNGCQNWLETPGLDLSKFEEVFVELWFYAKYQKPSGIGVIDYGRVQLAGATSSSLGILAVAYTGDLTADPTSDSGWRRALFRIKPADRMDGVKLRFTFRSDGSTSAEGLYIDQVRVVGSMRVACPTMESPNDPYYSRQYELRNSGQIAALGEGENDLHVPAAWDLAPVSTSVVIGVIDSGVDLTHPDLNLVPGADWNGSGDGHARGSHGTAVAGNAGATAGNMLGVTGTAPGVKIMPIYMGGAFADYAAAIDTAVAKGAQILTNSWGWVGAPSADIRSAIEDALDVGRVVLFAAGNGPDRPPYTYELAFPGSLTAELDVICVGASSPTDEYKGAASSDGAFHWGSSYVGDGPDVLAPGPWSYTTDIQGTAGYNDGSLIDPSDASSASYTPSFGGTSSATPKTAGIVALMLSANASLTPREVKRILRETADDVHESGIDDFTGAGRVNALQAVRRAFHP